MEKQNIKNTKLKGTVLFTVVSVMMVLIVFVMATLTIASAASKRSYNSYFKNQSLYSARSVVDTTVQELLKPGAGNDLKKAATGLNAGNKTLELSCDLPTGMGRVTDLKIEYAGVDQIGTSTFVTGSGDGIVKVTATVEMSGQTSTYSQYVLKSAVVTIPAISEGALVSMGHGMQGDATSPKVYGTTYSFNTDIKGIDDADYIKKVKDTWSQLRNDGSVNALSYNSSVYVNTALNATFDKGSGMYIGGHFVMQNIPNFRSKAEKGTDGLMYSDIPYIYVGGAFYKENTGSLTIGEKEKPINIYCGSINGAGGLRNFTTYGDVYAYDEHDGTLEIVGAYAVPQKGLSVFGDGGANGGSLLNWVDSLVNSTDVNFASHTGGSFYSNGKLIINSVSSFGGDVIVKGPVEINTTTTAGGNVKIGGSLYVGESLTISGSNGANEFTVNGGIFVGTGATVSIATGVTINGVPYGGEDINAYIAAVNAAADATKVVATQAKIDASPPTIFPKTMDKKYLFEGDETIADPDERAKTVTIIDSKTMLESFKVTINVGTPEETTEYKDYKAKPEDSGVCYNLAYEVNDKNFTESDPLTENCTLVGSWNENIYIRPEAGKSIWVCLANFSLEGSRIIVDNTTNPSNPGTVYFFVPDEGMASYDSISKKIIETPDGSGNITGDLVINGTGDGAGIITSYYANLDSAIDLTLYPLTLEGGAEINRPKIPNIYIYMAGGKKASEIESEEAPKLLSTNQSIITGYICAPYITLNFNKGVGVGVSGASIKYNETVVDPREKISVIGQVIVGDIEKFTNDNIVVQVSPNLSGGSGSDSGGGTKGGQWTKIENTYGFGG